MDGKAIEERELGSAYVQFTHEQGEGALDIQVPGAMSIISAHYGSAFQYDVTLAARNAVRARGNQLAARVLNEAFGDPQPGVKKKLRIVYCDSRVVPSLDGADTVMCSVEQNESEVAIRSHAGTSLYIFRAFYGRQRLNDVTKKARDAVAGGNGTELRGAVPNALFGDPEPNVAKRLRVFFANVQENAAVYEYTQGETAINMQAIGGHLRILCALYVGRAVHDVTVAARRNVHANNGVALVGASPNAMFGDPEVGVVKTLHIAYMLIHPNATPPVYTPSSSRGPGDVGAAFDAAAGAGAAAQGDAEENAEPPAYGALPPSRTMVAPINLHTLECSDDGEVHVVSPVAEKRIVVVRAQWGPAYGVDVTEALRRHVDGQGGIVHLPGGKLQSVLGEVAGEPRRLRIMYILL